MKSSFFCLCLLACILLFSVSCSRSEKLSGNEFLIEGEISGVEDGAVIILSRVVEGSGSTRIASDTLRNGQFIFKEEAQFNTEHLTIRPLGDGFPLMLLDVWIAPKAKIKIKGKGKLHPVWEVKSSVPYQKEENLYNNKCRDIIAEFAKISVESNDMNAKIRKASSEDEASVYRKVVDSLNVINDLLTKKLVFTYVDIMEQTDVSPIWLGKMMQTSLVLNYYDDGSESINELRRKAEILYGRMSEEDKNTSSGNQITTFLFPPSIVEVGDDFADGDFFDITGKTKHLSDYLGKYLLIDFWASWCQPCIMALPEMKEISETYRDKLTIISISIDSDAIWKTAMDTHDTPWANIRDPKGISGLAANYGVEMIPNYVMISPEGIIVDKWDGYGKGSIKEKVSENIK